MKPELKVDDKALDRVEFRDNCGDPANREAEGKTLEIPSPEFQNRRWIPVGRNKKRLSKAKRRTSDAAPPEFAQHPVLSLESHCDAGNQPKCQQYKATEQVAVQTKTKSPKRLPHIALTATSHIQHQSGASWPGLRIGVPRRVPGRLKNLFHDKGQKAGQKP